jgi:thioredoxin reductase (NADPH)
MSTVPEYDLAVIGGGSGGMAAAKEAAAHGAKVVLFDYVKPSTQGTTWGLGGTCVNVGCVPKKLMHYAANIGHTLHHDAEKYGFEFAEKPPQFKWEKLVETVQNHVRKLNFGYRTGLRSAKVTYVNALASFEDEHTIGYTLKGKAEKVSAKNVLIATGGRPAIPADVEGAREFAITSDDLFSLERTPGKTLVVGASYIALECAGLLTGLGFDTHVAVRSVLLRGFDRQCADKIGEMLRVNGTRFHQKLPTKMARGDDGKIAVTFSDGSADAFDTVLYATGRYADTTGLGLEKAGVQALADGKFQVNDREQTNVPHVYAIGDILKGRPELTPVAIKTGELLARRLFAGADKKMNWELIPTTVFTPAEYGAVGYSEEDAVQKFGAEEVETYLWEFTTLEHAAAHREKVEWERADDFDVDFPTSALCKLVTLKNQNEKVVGFHFVGPNAGEVTQGFAVAMRAGATKSDFDETVGIHPTDAEAFVTMAVTRSSGLDFVAAGGCGGGKCG